MTIETSRRGSYQVLSVQDEMTVHTDLLDLKKMIQRHVDEGSQDFALIFPPKSYLYTKSLSTLVLCADLIRKRGGNLAIVGANQDMCDILEAISLTALVRIVPDVASLDSANLTATLQQRG